MFGLINMIDWAVGLILFLVVCVFLMAQHNKNNVKLEPEEIEKLQEQLRAPNLSKKERRQILQKLKPQQKADKLRKSRHNKEQKKPKKDDQK